MRSTRAGEKVTIARPRALVDDLSGASLPMAATRRCCRRSDDTHTWDALRGCGVCIFHL